ncbi:GtrA family protein [Romboutsia maritimum]|uniref:GtrA family protein n=1 Tax=Romboutsia maritimum TaxID=2020948 RepID=A0A371IT50_9FIRM|nr:GtrA family protein [Romboutsia maritimum]
MTHNFKNLKHKIIEYIKFNIIGISNFLISQMVYLLLFLKLKLNYILAYTITSVLSIIAAYFLNSKFTFKENKLSLKKFYLTGLVYIFEYILNLGIIILMIKYLSFSKIIAPLIAPLFSTPLIFFLMRFVIKKK